jgi:2-dehydro-3-deoxyphosphogluconate aldolase / (4S)-4-hydroxy-2-oxoglutarate aldolase
MSKFDVAAFKRLPILGILRGIEPDHLEPLLETIESSGLRTIEITMNTKGAAALIRKAVALSHLTIGAGTVVDQDGLAAALDAGASFIIMPVLVPDVVGTCVKKGIPVFPGALTPQEIYAAWRSGATMVKVFPSGFFGPQYFREIKGPFADIELLACGGVTPENMGSYFANGASAVSFGASVFKKEWLAQKDLSSIGREIRKFTDEFSRIAI